MAFTIEFTDTFTAKSPDASIVSAPSATVKYSFDADADLKTDEGKQLQGIIAVEFQKRWRAGNRNRRRSSTRRSSGQSRITKRKRSGDQGKRDQEIC